MLATRCLATSALHAQELATAGQQPSTKFVRDAGSRTSCVSLHRCTHVAQHDPPVTRSCRRRLRSTHVVTLVTGLHAPFAKHMRQCAQL